MKFNDIATKLNPLNPDVQAKARNITIGNGSKNGLFLNIVVYVLLVAIGFVYVYPLLYMLMTSFKSLADLLDAAISWVPRQITLDNFREAFVVMRVSETIVDTFYVSLVPALAQTASCALIGYGFARFKFPLKRLFLGLVLLTFIIPQHILLVPTFVMFSNYGILGSIGTILYPALLGQGMKSAIFILIFMQFFSLTPTSLDEAARVDGAGEMRVFIRIALPLAIPALVVGFLFSFVWYWNDTYFLSLFMGGHATGTHSTVSTLLMELNRFEASYLGFLQSLAGQWAAGQGMADQANEAIHMAATLITILPLLIIYLILQRQFVESIDKTGITGE